MTDVLQVLTTADNRETALQLLQSAVSAKLAASGQVSGPVASAFWHLGELGKGEEWVLTLRTTRDRYEELEQHLIEHHPWDNPEVTFTVIAGGSASYMNWVRQATSA
ncbi:divalent-cation tolerance protein CutA [Actinomadura rupiterrae]|uniref:divalent-cation tolerance protein CutA n=1 Tax=Actinomadura rupiterrae TaxID=559627 RepID=UPI0020A3403A|nr:divalent-cation tolerance protein CutA [Actinomadura rupiterrae]MCP2342732.1 periplasmic divalent cation tolerance protein [Actinomadura rupiterrae]